MNRRAAVLGLACLTLGGCLLWALGRVVGNLRKAALEARAEVLAIADGRSLDDMRQRSQQAREYADYSADRHGNMIEAEKPLVALMKSHTWKIIVWWTEDRGLAEFDLAAFGKDWKLPTWRIWKSGHAAGRRPRDGRG